MAIAPLKRHPALVPLSRDHHDALMTVWKMREGLKRKVDPVRIRDFVAYAFDNESLPHFAAEEELLFAQMLPGDELRFRAEKEHGQMRELLSHLRTSADKMTLAAMADLLESHVRFEERELFPYLQEKFSEKELTGIATAMAGREKKACAAWPDSFWMK